MADRMKWLSGVFAACMLVVVFVYSIDIADIVVRENGSEANRLSTELFREERALREAVWADALLPRVPASAGLHVDVLADIDSSADSMLRAAVQVDWSRISAPVARVAVFVIPDTLGEYHHGLRGSIHSVYYGGEDDGGPRCAVVIPVRTLGDGSSIPSLRFHAPLLGPCVWWAKHGQPGAHIAEWLRNRDGYNLGAWSQPPGTDTVTVRYERQFAKRPALGQFSPFALSCIQDDSAACMRIVNDPLPIDPWLRLAPADGLPIHRKTPYSRDYHFAGQEQFIFAELEREFGVERFAQFWHSDQDVDEAFTGAFGVPFGVWVQQWARQRFPDVAEHSDERPVTLALSLLTLLVLSGAGVVGAHRRQLG